MALNHARGDVALNLGDDRFTLRPSFAAIVALEEHFGRGIFDIARDFAEGRLNRAGDLTAMAGIGIKGAGREPPADLPQRMVEAGLAGCIVPLGKFLIHACGIEA